MYQNSINFEIIKYLIENAYKWESIEFADNILSGYIAQKGICPILHKPLHLHNMDCHHIKPRVSEYAENNTYQNLIVITTDMHRLIHVTKEKTIQEYLQKYQLNDQQIDLINKFRVHAGNDLIKF